MSDQHGWLAGDLRATVLACVVAAREDVAEWARDQTGDEHKPVQAAFVAAVGRLDELSAQLREVLAPAALGVVAVPAGSGPRPEPGTTTDPSLRRMRKNSAGRHRSTP